MKLLDQHQAARKEIFAYFGYVEDWRILPIEDSREVYWSIIGGEGRGGKVRYATTLEIQQVVSSPDFDLDSFAPNYEAAPTYYENEIYTQRFLPKWVYRGKDYTMICVDTHTDMNQFLQIFDNAKEVK